MPAAGVVMIIAVLLIVAAVVYFLVSTIVALRKITHGLDDAIAGVVQIIEKSAPVKEVVDDINANLDAGVDLLEGLLVKKAGLDDAIGLIDGLYPGAGGGGAAQRSAAAERQAAADRRGLHARDADAGPARPRGADRRRLPERPGAAQPVLRVQRRPRRCTRSGAAARRQPAALAGDRRRLAGAVRPRGRSRGSAQADARHGRGAESGIGRELTRRCRPPHRSSYERATSVEGAIASLIEHDGDARIIAGGHSLLPMMKLRLANPEHLIDINDLDELSYIRETADRDPDRRADPARRAAALRAAGSPLPAVRRRRGGDRRPGRPQPRHDRRLAVPGRRGRGPAARSAPRAKARS